MSFMPPILVTGAAGVLGSYVRQSLEGQSVLLPSSQELDITDFNQVATYFAQHKPTTVIHLAALTNVDECQRSPEKAMLVNGEATGNLAKLCRTNDAFMVYVSTAAVFDGQQECAYEDDPTGPVNAYGQSKLLGETLLQEALTDFLIIRSAWLIGGGAQEKKFISYIVDQARTRDQIEAVDDKVGTITYAKELATWISQHLDGQTKGIYHYGSNGAASRYEIAQKVVEIIGSQTKVVPVPSSRFETTFSAPRPTREVIGSHKIDWPHTWQESLEDYIRHEIS